MKTRIRGAVLYETAIVLPLVLLILVSTIRTGILGYDQLQADAAAMTYARYSALNIANPQTQTQNLFPSTSNYAYAAPTTSPAPAVSPAIDWSQQIGGLSNMNQYNRHGGQAVIVPAALQTLVTTPLSTFFFGPFTKNVKVTGSDIEPLFLECGGHWMVGESSDPQAGGGNTGPGDGTGTDCSSSQNAASYESFFQNGENTPPYYLSQRYLEVCNDNGNLRPDNDYWDYSVPGGGSHGFGPAGWNTCGQDDNGNPDGGQPIIWPLGAAQYLDVHNWYRPLAGWGGTASPTAISTLTTFRDIACHQHVYYYIAQSLSANYGAYIDPGTPATFSPTDPQALKYADWQLTPDPKYYGNTVSFWQIIHSWDSQSETPGGAIAAVDTDQTYALNPLGQAAGPNATGWTGPATYCGTTVNLPDGNQLTPTGTYAF
jgi:hypothetical protein